MEDFAGIQKKEEIISQLKNSAKIGTAIRLIDGSLFSVIVNITNVSRKDKTDETKIFTFMQSDHSWTSNI